MFVGMKARSYGRAFFVWIVFASLHFQSIANQGTSLGIQSRLEYQRFRIIDYNFINTYREGFVFESKKITAHVLGVCLGEIQKGPTA